MPSSPKTFRLGFSSLTAIGALLFAVCRRSRDQRLTGKKGKFNFSWAKKENGWNETMGIFLSKLFVKETVLNDVVEDHDKDEDEDYTISVHYRYIYGDIPTVSSERPLHK